MKKKSKLTKAQKRRTLIFGTFSFFLISYFIVNLAVYSFRIYNIKKLENELTVYLKEKKIEEADLKDEIKKLNDPDYIARFAREKYNYSKEGEYIIEIVDDKPKVKIVDPDFKFDLKLIIPAASALLLSVFYVIKKVATK